MWYSVAIHVFLEFPVRSNTFFVFVLLTWVAVNYVAISEALGVSPSVLAAGLAADNVICAAYFTTLFALASKIPPEATKLTNSEQNYEL